MNFFEQQDRARGSTRRLVLLFALAVASLVVITSLLVVVLLGFAEGTAAEPGAAPELLLTPLLVSRVFLWVTLVVVGVVLLGALFRMAQLRGGGRVIAENLGGRRLPPGSRDPDERRILNVVEEMAIAAGVPVPPVYLLDDPAINAFAAGWGPEDAVIGITRGCLQLLTRDELQGVVAHEFSHIFNGDMRLNIRLIGWLYGIMVIGMIGYLVLRAGGRNWAGAGKRRNNGAGIMLLAIGLVVIGYGGTFFGNLIKAAVSRQREYLADASAVQYTRNPDGIAGALKKIAAQGEAARMRGEVSEVSHLLFAQGIKAGFTGLLATHPPLAQRIRRIHPGWDGGLPDLRQAAATRAAADRAAGAGAATTAGAGTGRAGAAERAAGSAATGPQLPLSVLAAAVVATVGEPDAEHLSRAVQALEALPAGLREEVREPLGASLVLSALLLAAEPQQQGSQLQLLQAQLGAAELQQLQGLRPLLAAVRPDQRLLLVELALPALKELSEAQRQAFLHLQQELCASDGHISLFEWCVLRLLQRQLQELPARSSSVLELAQCQTACSQLLSALCHAGHQSAAEAAAAFAAGCSLLQQSLTLLPAATALESAALDQALEHLQALAPLQKPQLLQAMVACVAHDGRLEAAEGDLLRLAALLLDCPLPPLPLSFQPQPPAPAAQS